MAVFCGIRTFDIIVHQIDGTIRRGTVNDQVSDLRIVLLKHAVECALHNLRSLISDGDVGNPDHSP